MNEQLSKAIKTIVSWLDWSGGLPEVGGESMTKDLQELRKQAALAQREPSLSESYSNKKIQAQTKRCAQEFEEGAKFDEYPALLCRQLAKLAMRYKESATRKPVADDKGGVAALCRELRNAHSPFSSSPPLLLWAADLLEKTEAARLAAVELQAETENERSRIEKKWHEALEERDALRAELSALKQAK